MAAQFGLTDPERLRFASWLEAEAEAGENMATTMEKLGGKFEMQMATQTRNEATAAKIVAAKLRAYERG